MEKSLCSKKNKIVIVEDHEIFRMGLKELISQESDLIVTGEASNIDNAWRLVKKSKPDMLIVDITLEGSNGIDLIKDINKLYPDLPMLVLSMHDESLYAQRSLSAGASGYIMKQETSESVIKAIRHILNGNIYVSEKIMGNILFQYTANPNSLGSSPIEMLTNREFTVFQLIGEGNSSKDIAKKLNLSVKTIGTYRERLKEKFNLKNAAELMRFAVHWIDSNK